MRIYCVDITNDQLHDLLALTVHWDGKCLPEMTGDEKIERLPIVVSSNGIDKLLGVPKLQNGTGRKMADAVIAAVTDWKIQDRIQAMCFDTTASNTGNVKGACRFVEEGIGRELVHFACRHHVYEIVLRQAFEVKFGKDKQPEVRLFQDFKKQWKDVDPTKFKSGMEDEYVRSKIGADADKVLLFCLEQLEKSQIREDYKEFLELVVLFLGHTPPKFNGKLRKIGPISHARWMAKAITALKMFLVRDQIQFDGEILTKLRDFCIFVVKMYAKAWFSCTNGVVAANQDLHFIKNAILYSNVDDQISGGILEKMCGHMWYLSEDLVAMAFFDPIVSFAEKRKMVENVRNRIPIPANRIKVDVNSETLRQTYSTKNLSDFVSTKSQQFFDRFCIETEFMDFDPSTWMTRDDYKEGYEFCRGLHVVNDTAERGVKLITDYNKIISVGEQDKQYLLQVVEQYRRKYSDANKSTLMKQ